MEYKVNKGEQVVFKPRKGHSIKELKMLNANDRETIEDIIAGSEKGVKDLVETVIAHEEGRARCYLEMAYDTDNFNEEQRMEYARQYADKQRNMELLKGIVEQLQF